MSTIAQTMSVSDAEVGRVQLTFELGLHAGVPVSRFSHLFLDLDAAILVLGSKHLKKDKTKPGRPPSHVTDLWRRTHSGLEAMTKSPLTVRQMEYGSPASLLLELPWQTYAASGGGFLTAVGFMFGAPHLLAGRIHRSREEYWKSRLAADSARAEYLKWRRDVNERDDVRLIDAAWDELPEEVDDPERQDGEEEFWEDEDDA